MFVVLRKRKNEEAYDEDEVIRRHVNMENVSAKEWAEKLYKQKQLTKFSITGSKTSVPNGATENWQKAIGAHYIWGSANVRVDGNKMIMQVTIHAFNDIISIEACKILQPVLRTK